MNNQLKNEYPGLLTISIILNVIGVLIALLAIIGLIYGLSLLNDYELERQMSVYYIISSLVGGLLFSVPFFALAELIKVLVRIEFNTRKDFVDEMSRRFENDSNKQKTVNKNDNSEISYEVWKKENLGKTINDYYASRRRHS